MPASTQEVQERIAALGPWFYEFDLGVHGRTASVLSPEILPIHQTRLEMVSRVVDGYFGGRLDRIRCVDVGCHEGFYSVAIARTCPPGILANTSFASAWAFSTTWKTPCYACATSAGSRPNFV